MNWKQINNEQRIQPSEGVYSDWKQQVSNDCYNQCVYCSIHENPWGGIDHFHIEHFRPKSKFANLKDTITNLYHACPICNKFKSDDWPNEPDLNKISYPDPAEINYSNLFQARLSTFEITGKYIASNYLVNRLYLNRPQLIYERREEYLKVKAEKLIDEVREKLISSNDVDIKNQAITIILDMLHHLNIRGKIIPYKLIEIRKP